MEYNSEILDTLIVPASPEGFQRVFIGENCWYSFKLSKKSINNLKYIAVYQTKPVSAITHYAVIAELKSHENSKYIALFKHNSVVKIEPIKYDHTAVTAIQGPRYFNLKRMLNVKSLREIVG